jgi:RimJ/RimL family protein N-acetyltransferase
MTGLLAAEGCRLDVVKKILETERLVIREFVAEDAEAFFAFNGDPEVTRHTGEPPTESVEQARRMILAYPDYRRHGFGRWAVVVKREGRVVGFNGLKYLPELDEVDLGFRLHRDWWGLGIATESSRAIVRHGFEALGLERIVGLVLDTNARSIRVLEKVGMRPDGRVVYFGDPVQRWVIERGDGGPRPYSDRPQASSANTR